MDIYSWESTHPDPYRGEYRWRSERLLWPEEIYRMNDWCRERCKGNWHCSASSQVWCFNNPNDHMMFSLRWSDK